MLFSKCPSCLSPLTPREAEGVGCPACGASLQSGRGAPAAVPAEPAPYTTSDRRPPAVGRGAMGTFSLICSLLALLLAIYAVVHVVFNDPFGIALWRYDFSSPSAALVSQSNMEANRDIRAILAYEYRVGDEVARERARTLKIEQEVEWKNGKVVFYKYQRKGSNQYEADYYLKDEKTGFWKRRYLSDYSRNAKDEMRIKIAEWRNKSDKMDLDED